MPDVVCLATPSVRNATTTHQHDMWEVGEEVTATCNGDLYFADAQVQTRQVLCTYNGWVESPGCETGEWRPFGDLGECDL